MRMIPAQQWNKQSRAETELFARFRDLDFESAVCLHSLNLARHLYKKLGEVDFLILSRAGIFVLEVKGGGVKCADGIWTYTDRFGEEHRNSEGPFNQATSAMFSLRKQLIEKIGRGIEAIPFGYGVVLPDCNFKVTSVEWPAEVVADAALLNRPKGLESYLKRLSAHWAKKGAAPVDPTLFSTILQYVRPSFELAPSLGVRAKQLDAKMDALTADQCAVMDYCSLNDRILCDGGAGTGKTFLAIEVARREASQGKKVLLTCHGPVLASFILSRLGKHATVLTFDALRASSAALKFDVLIVDEGQDLLAMDALDVLEVHLEGGLTKGRWRFFMDKNNQGGLVCKADVDASAYLETMSTRLALSRNCRNTEDIAIQTRLLTGADLGVAIAGHGPPVEISYYGEQKQVDLLRERLRQLAADDVAPGDITLLSSLPFDQSVASKLPRDIASRIVRLNAKVAADWPSSAMTFGMIPEFKGLENRFIIVLDLITFEATLRDTAMLYVAMSRARAALQILFPEALRPVVKRISESNMAAVVGSLGARGGA